MDNLENIREGFLAIKTNKLRTILTSLIISIGIMALVGILTSIDGLKKSLYSNFSLMGANSFKIENKGIGIRMGKRGSHAKAYPPIHFEEAEAFKNAFNEAATVAVSTTVSSSATVKNETAKTNANITIIGGDEGYAATTGYLISSGRNFSKADLENNYHVTIIGQEIKERLFKNNDPLSKLISIGNNKFQIIGVFEKKGSSPGLSGDKICLIPLPNARAMISSSNPTYSITVQVPNSTQIDPVSNEAIGKFRSIRRLDVSQENDFDVSKSDELINELLANTTKITMAATAIGVITLLGASIALMNIMLVSVTERTREIGIRKAIGATSAFIRRQFLVEALIICQMGGVGGIFLGIVIGNVVSMLTGGGFIVPWLWMFGGLVLCVMVGLLSGFYPAYKASKLDPVESLRYE